MHATSLVVRGTPCDQFGASQSPSPPFHVVVQTGAAAALDAAGSARSTPLHVASASAHVPKRRTRSAPDPITGGYVPASTTVHDTHVPPAEAGGTCGVARSSSR